MERLRFGVVGLRFGRHLVSTLANILGVQIAAVADRNPSMPGGLAAYAAHYGATPYHDGVTMIREETLDAVILATPPRGREALIEAAATKGLPMFVEKPWAADNAQAARLATLCAATGARVMVAFSFRFHPAIVKLRELLDGELGPGLLLNGEYLFHLNPPPDSWLWDPANGNGIFNENSGHLFDAVCYLLGKPVAVSAETINPFVTPAAHAAAVTLRFAGGAVAALTLGGIGTPARLDFPRLDLVTANGQAMLRGRHHIWEEVHWATRTDRAMQSLSLPPEILAGTRYTEALTHFIHCVRSGAQPSVGIAEGATAVALAMAVAESAARGQRVLLE